MNEEIVRLVKMSLAFHNLNKKAESSLGLSLVQYYLLTAIRDMPACSLQRLADAVEMHPSTLTQSIKRLQKKECVFVAEDPKDSRKKILTMTRDGQKLLEGFMAGVDQVLKSEDSGGLLRDRILIP